MKANLLITVILPLLFGQPDNPYPSIGAIPVPAGYRRIPADRDPFADWLRRIPLKKNKTVYLFDGRPKVNQDAQFAVLDVSVGRQDLQQCADAIMRLRSEFFYSRKEFGDINFYTEQGIRLNFGEWINGNRFKLHGNQLIRCIHPGVDSRSGARSSFDEYLRTVFTFCGTRSLERQLVPAGSFENMQIGDVLIHGGSPGHAMLVVDMAADEKGHKICLLAQSYMPAQDIHIVKNPSGGGGPWYSLEEDKPVNTPEYTFYPGQLRRWPKTP